MSDLVILKYNRFGPGYKPLQDHKHKLALIDIPIRIVERFSLLSYRLNLSSDSRIHDMISIIYLRKFNDISDDINLFLIIMNNAEK